MAFREWLHAELTSPGNVELNNLLNGRVFAKKSMKSSREEHPYVVHKLGNNTSEGLAEGVFAERQYLQIYVHDYKDTTTGDYTQIDSVLRQLKSILEGASSAEHDLLNIIYLETSQDLDDETLGTVMKYIRFQAILGKAE